MEYFVRTMERNKEGAKTPYPELRCPSLDNAMGEAIRIVRTSNPSIMLQAEACSRNRGETRTKYRCWIDERGAIGERSFQ